MDHHMDLCNVKMFVDSFSDKHGLVFVEGFEGFWGGFEGLRDLRGMYLKLWVIDEVHDHDSCVKDCRLNCSDQKTCKNMLHLFMLVTYPLWNERDTILEVSEV